MNLICLFKGHNFYLIERLSKDIQKLGCKRCKKLFAKNDWVQLILPWDSDFEDMYKLHRESEKRL